MMVSVACQTITWGDEKNRNSLSEVLKDIKEAGYNAFEIGFRHLDPQKSEYYKGVMVDNGIDLLALHIGGDFLDPESIKRQMSDIGLSIKMAVELDAGYIFLSGTYREGKTVVDYKVDADNYNKIGKMCIESGLKFCYHNHNWEIDDHMLGFKTLLDYTDGKLVYFVPDVGWITMGGANPAAVLRDCCNRIEVVHFKEFTVDNRFTELGNGIVDFKGVYDVLKKKENLHIVSEQDQTTRTPLESAIINRRYIEALTD